MREPLIIISNNRVSVTMPDGRCGSMSIDQWPRLASASPEQLADFYTCGEGVHWPSLDEDITFECILRGGERRSGLYGLFMSMPWLNVSALARKMGISQSLMAQYVSGTKRPSAKRLAEIESHIHHCATELAAVKLT